VVADPHEIANVMGTEGVDYIVRSTDGIPLNVYIGIPSAVPATQLAPVSQGDPLEGYDLA
jgi:adenine deaminase